MQSDATSWTSYKCKYNIQAKGNDKSNAELNFFSSIGFIQHFSKSKYRSDVYKIEGKENKLQSDGTWTTSWQYKYSDKGQQILTRTMQS